MTDEQKRTVRILAECHIWNPLHRARVGAWAAQLLDAPDAPLMAHHASALMGYLHTYRRQHRRCQCEICFGNLIGQLQEPTQFSLFEPKER